MINLRGRNFLTLLDFTPSEIRFLIDNARSIKQAKLSGQERPLLTNKSICLLFQKDSTRTRASFEIGAGDQGAHTVYFGPSGSHFAKKESVVDSAQVLGRMFDGIEFRGYRQSDLELLAKHAGVPVWNGLTDEYHPTQILSDFLTILEQKRYLKGIRFAYYGDAKNNMGNSLMIGAVKMGMHFVCVAPKAFWPEKKLIDKCREIAIETEATLTFTEDPIQGAKNADVIYTDVWVSMGEPDSVWKERLAILKPYQVTMRIMRAANPEVMFLHCLPAFHDRETEVGEMVFQKFGLTELEVTDEVFKSKYSRVFDQAENRLHTIKALMMATI